MSSIIESGLYNRRVLCNALCPSLSLYEIFIITSYFPHRPDMKASWRILLWDHGFAASFAHTHINQWFNQIWCQQIMMQYRHWILYGFKGYKLCPSGSEQTISVCLNTKCFVGLSIGSRIWKLLSEALDELN